MRRVEHMLIIGASRGLGLALVRRALQDGAQVTAIARVPAEELKGLAARKPDRLSLCFADVRSERDFERVARELPADMACDTLVYNAAIHLEHDRRDIELASPDDMLETLNVNSVGAARAVKHLRRFLKPRGLLVLISSEAGSISDARRTSEYGYCMSKAALNMLAQLLKGREQERESQVQVIALHPGFIRTDMGGPTAHISAEESATAIAATLRERLRKPGPTFIDRFGKALAW